MDDLKKLTKLHIEKVYFVKFGSAYISNKLLSKGDRGKKSSGFMVDLEKAFDNSQNVINWERIKLFKTEHFMTRRFSGQLITFFYNPYHLNMSFYPKIEEGSIFGFSLFGKEKADFSKKFNIIYNGIHYLYYRECDLSKIAYLGAPEAREEFYKIFKDKFNLIHFVPTPLREDFIFIFSKKKTDIKSPLIIGNRYYFIFEKPADFKKFFARILSKEHTTFDIFYRGTDIDKKMNNITLNFNSEYSNIFDLISKLQKLNWINIIKKYKINNKINKKFSELYRLIGKYIDLEEELLENKKKFLDCIRDSIFLVIKLQLKKEYEYHKKLNYRSLLQTFQTIRYNIEDYQKNTTLILTIIFSLISAIIGGLVASLIQ